MCECSGAGNGSHPFLKAEGTYECFACKKILCYVCSIQMEKTNKNELYCINCYGEEKSIPTLSISLTDHVSRSDMIRELAQIGTWIKDSADIDIDAMEIPQKSVSTLAVTPPSSMLFLS
jgi:hypothetical protein